MASYQAESSGTMDSDKVSKTLQLPTFDGEEKNFSVWWMRFQAYASVYGFDVAIKTKKEADLPGKEDEVLDETTAEGKKKMMAKKRNKIAFANLTMAFTNASTMNKVHTAKTDDWPGGLACEVIRQLHQEYQPKDRISRVEMGVRLNSVKIKDSDDPKKLAEQLSAIENEYNTENKKIEKDDLVAVALSAAPKKYAAALTVIQKSIAQAGKELTVNDLLKAMREQWRIKNSGRSNKQKDDSDDNEIVSEQ